MRYATALRSLLFSFVLLVLSQASFGQVVVSVGFGPPAIPIYEQPICPGDGYMWTPGYWAYDDADGYYWVPGTWILAPEPGFLWTPGYWGWGGSAFLWHAGYWGPHIGFYGGINYGFGYFGNGFEGGRWENNHFFYNTAVVHVNETIIHNTYRTTIVENNRSRVAFNGGEGGINARASADEERYASERHVGPVAAQEQHRDAARGNPQLRASANQGRPPIAATQHANDFKSGAVGAREAGGEYHAPPANAARGNQGDRPANDTRKATYNHANEVQQHQFTPPNTGNAKTDAKYQQQQQKLAAKQNADHQKLQQRQDREHQQAETRQANDTQKQQMETRHTQQTQKMETQHAQQQTRMEQHQGGGGGHPEGGRPH